MCEGRCFGSWLIRYSYPVEQKWKNCFGPFERGTAGPGNDGKNCYPESRRRRETENLWTSFRRGQRFAIRSKVTRLLRGSIPPGSLLRKKSFPICCLPPYCWKWGRLLL